MRAQPFEFGFHLGAFIKQSVDPDPMAAVNAERVKQMKEMAAQVQAASGMPNPAGDGVHRYSGRVMPGGEVQNAQYSHTPATGPQMHPTHEAVGRLVGDPAGVQARYDSADSAMQRLGFGGEDPFVESSNSDSPAAATPAGDDDSLILPSQAPSQPRPMVPNITRPAQRPSFTPNTSASPASAPAPAPTPAPAPATPQLSQRDINRQAFEARRAERAQAQGNSRAARAANGGRPVPGSGRLPSQSSATAAPAAAPSAPASAAAPAPAPTPAPTTPSSSGSSMPGPAAWAEQLGASLPTPSSSYAYGPGGGGAPSAGGGGTPSAGGGVGGTPRANGTMRPQFGSRTVTPAPRPSMGRRYGVSPVQQTADYRAAR